MQKTECEIKLTGDGKHTLNEAFRDLLEFMESQSCKDSEINTLYYDDENATLHSKGIMLRYRTVDNLGYVCMKANTKNTESGIAQRDEWEVRADSLSEGLCRIIQFGGLEIEQMLGECGELLNCASVSFGRKQMEIVYEKTRMEICLDMGTFGKEGACEEFYEIEAELIDGSREALASLLGYLRTKYRLRTQERSKYERARACDRQRNMKD